MATFNGTYENAYAQQLMGEFFRNSLRYFKGDVRNSEYFNPVVSMLNEREMKSRIEKASVSEISMTNYGTAISKMNGILDKSLKIFKK
jgi:hypothetical protein